MGNKISKAKAQGIVLQQSSGDEAVVEVPEGSAYIFSGTMRGCCTVAVLWGKPQNSEDYRYMRAQHGAGGPQAIGWTALMKGVPTDGNTLVVASCAPEDKELYEGKLGALLAHFKYTYKPQLHTFTNIMICRNGDVEDASGVKKMSEYAEQEKKLLGGIDGSLGLNAMFPITFSPD